MYTVNDANLPWLKNVHNIINECELAYIWKTQTFINSDWFISLVKQTLKDQYNQLWHPQTENSANVRKLIDFLTLTNDLFFILI
jgi:hypothetical protein